MNKTLLHRWGTIFVLLLLASGFLLAQEPTVPPFNRDDPPGDPPPVPGAPGEVQGRGPIHEAYAQPNEATPRPSPIISKRPPDPIQELPPDDKPEGDSVMWIPGYWAWDEDRSDFLWVSGFWRVVPPGRKWVPGYWTQAEGGWRWVTGFWADAGQETAPYVQPPPASLDYGPSVPQPQDDYFYVPGSWIYREERWFWRPGYWYECQPGWVYCPPCYHWTPRGCIFVSGYWDRPLDTRGVLFAPVYFSAGVYSRPGFCYRPSYAVSFDVLFGSLWVRNGWGCYAFGDYYGNRYARGYQPWINHSARHRDPLYNYYRTANRRNPAWRRNLVSTYEGRVKGTVPVPPRTLAAQQRALASKRNRATPLRVVQPLSEFRSDSLRLARMSNTERVQRQKQAVSFREASVERHKVEGRRNPGSARPANLSLSRIPAAAPGQMTRPADQPKKAPRLSAGRPPATASKPQPQARPADNRPRVQGTNRAPEMKHRPEVRRSAKAAPSMPERKAPALRNTAKPKDTPPLPNYKPRHTMPSQPRANTPSRERSAPVPRAAPPAARNDTPPPRLNPIPTTPRYTPPARTYTPMPRVTPAVPRVTPSVPRVVPSVPRMAPRAAPRAAPRPAPRAMPRAGRRR